MPNKSKKPLLWTIGHAIFGQPAIALDWVLCVVIGVAVLISTWGLGGWLFFGTPMNMVTQVVALAMALYGLKVLLDPEERGRINPLGFIFIPFLALAGISYAFLTPAPAYGRLELAMWLQALALFWIVLHALNRRSRLYSLLGVFAVAGMVSVGVAFLTRYMELPFLGLENGLPLGRVKLDQYAGRMSGTFGVPNNFAAFLLLFLPLCVVIAGRPRFPLAARIMAAFCGLLFFLGILFSVSRGAYLGLGVAVLALPFALADSVKGAFRTLFRLVSIVVILGGIFIGLNYTARERFSQAWQDGGESTRPQMWEGAADIFLDHPLVGSGIGSYQVRWDLYRPEPDTTSAISPSMGPKFAHNDYLQTLSDLGLFGFIFLFAPVLLMALLGLRKLRQDSKVRQSGHERDAAERAKSMQRELREKERARESRSGSSSSSGHRKKRRRRSKKKTEEVKPANSRQVLLMGLLIGLLAFHLHLVVDFHLKLPAIVFAWAILLGVLGRLSLDARWELPGKKAARILIAVCAFVYAGVIYLTGVPAFSAAKAYFQASENYDIAREDSSVLYLDEAFTQETEQLFEKTLELQPRHADAAADLASFYIMQARLFPSEADALAEKALALSERALEVDPLNWRYHAFRGSALWILGRPEAEVREVFTHATELAPYNATAWYYLAYLESRLGDRREEALQALQRALELDPRHENAQNLQSELMLN